MVDQVGSDVLCAMYCIVYVDWWKIMLWAFQNTVTADKNTSSLGIANQGKTFIAFEIVVVNNTCKHTTDFFFQRNFNLKLPSPSMDWSSYLGSESSNLLSHFPRWKPSYCNKHYNDYSHTKLFSWRAYRASAKSEGFYF